MDIVRILLKHQLENNKGASFVIIPTGNKLITPNDYLNWINYVPSHFSIDEILNKNAGELSEEEIKILSFLQKENQVKPYFKNFVSSEEKTTSSSVLVVYDYMKSISINKYADIKLTKEEREECINIVNKIDSDDIETSIEIFSSTASKGKDYYIIYLLKRRLYSIRMSRSDKELNAQLQSNLGMEYRKQRIFHI